MKMVGMKKVLNTVSENKAYLEACQKKLGFHLSINIKSCDDKLFDLETVKVLLESLGVDVDPDVALAKSLFVEFLKCRTKSIFKQLDCFKSVISKAKAAIAESNEEYGGLSPEVKAVIIQLEEDFQGCVGTLSTIDTKLRLCKLKLATRN